MSSTNRGSQRSESDYYGTPYWVTQRLLDRVTFPVDGIWYEPCAGEGAIVQVVSHKHSEITWWLNEIRPETNRTLRNLEPMSPVTTGDYLASDLELPPRERVSVVITNPPFRIAWEVLHKSLQEFPKSFIVLLLRLNFVASQRRYEFMSRYMPDLYVLPNRPSYKGAGKTDSPEYAWFVWGPSPRFQKIGTIQVLDLTPLEERKRDYWERIIHPGEK